MNSGSWVGDLLAERQREAEVRRLEAEREVLRHKKFLDLAPMIWSEIESRIRACLEVFNRQVVAGNNRLAIKSSGSCSIIIGSEARPLQALAVFLSFDSGVLRYGYAASPQSQQALIVRIDQESHWTLEDPRTRTDVPIDYVERLILSDYLKSLPL